VPKTAAPKKKADATTNALDMDMAGLNIEKSEDGSQAEELPPPKVTIARERVLEEARKEVSSGDSDGRKRLSLVVIGELLF
jgi:hypothetical protein